MKARTHARYPGTSRHGASTVCDRVVGADVLATSDATKVDCYRCRERLRTRPQLRDALAHQLELEVFHG